MIPIESSYPLSKMADLRQSGGSLDWATSRPRPSDTASCNRLDSVRVTFNRSDAQKGQRPNLSRQLPRMIGLQRDRAQDDIKTCGDSWFHPGPEYEFVSLPRDEKFPNGSDRRFNRKVHAEDCLESARIPFD
jgi:hypothetical protein